MADKELPTQLDFASDRDSRFAKLEADDAAKAPPPKDGAPKDDPKPSPLFEDPDGDTPADTLFDDEPSGTADSDKDPRVPKKRLDKVIAQRNEERKNTTQLREQNAELRGEINVLKTQSKLAKVFQDKYGQFNDPEKQALWDTNFMDAMEALAKQNPEVATAARLVTEHLGGPPVNITTKPNEPTTEPEPKTDPAIAKIIQRDARRTIGDSLESLNVKPAFAKVVTAHILEASSDLAELDNQSVIAATREFIRENGFEPDDVLKQAPADSKPDDKKAPAKPPTGSDRQAATTTPSQSKAGEPQGDKQAPNQPATRDEWEANRQDRLAALGSDLGLE